MSRLRRHHSDEHDSQPSRRAAPTAALDEREFDALFRACAADVHGYAISLLGDRAAAEDVTAQAFERLYLARRRLDRSRGTPRGWLFAIARNAALDELRRRRRRPERRLDERDHRMHVAQAPSADAVAEADTRASVRSALTQLSLREREVVLLKFHGQLSNAELARALGISESNAGTRLHRALSRLRDAYQAAEQEVA